MLRLCKAHVQFHARDAEGDLSGTRVAETTGSQRDVDLVGFAFDEAMIKSLAIFFVKVHGHRAATTFGSRWTKDSHQRSSIAVLHLRKIFEQPSGKRLYAFTDHFVPNGFDMPEADLERGDVEIIEGAIFKSGGTFCKIIFV